MSICPSAHQEPRRSLPQRRTVVELSDADVAVPRLAGMIGMGLESDGAGRRDPGFLFGVIEPAQPIDPSRSFSFYRLGRALHNLYAATHADVVEHIDSAADPMYFDTIHTFLPAVSKCVGPVERSTGWNTRYDWQPLSAAARRTLHAGPNVIAIHVHQTTGGQGIDVGMVDVVKGAKVLPAMSKVTQTEP